MLGGQMAGLWCSTGFRNMANGSESVILLQADHMQRLDHPSWAAQCFWLLGLVWKRAFFLLFTFPLVAFASVVQFLTARENMLAHGILPWCQLDLHPKDWESVLLAKSQLSQDISHIRLHRLPADLDAFGCSSIYGEGSERREGTNTSKFSKPWKALLRKIQLEIKKAIKTQY